MATATIYTRDGEVHEMEINDARDGRWIDDLPFDSADVMRTAVTEDR
ncbi:hypothetical protein [Streptomonospora salina]|uniref:Uncharacterized protein n=1 Tax=Streptomonospora salina TaxID=104205 RepID=A0A841EIV4_9ACTN|nr:hypothetical protein [Streptomonospora salina]MBB6001319.1 hypothetical protein [Streptomonospora salina]